MENKIINGEDPIDVIRVFRNCLKNWYWFALSCVCCVGIVLVYVLHTTPRYEVSSTFMMRSNPTEFGSLSAVSDMLTMMNINGTSNVEDELYIINSRTVMRQALKRYDVQTEYRKKKGLRWVGQYIPRDLTMHLPVLFADTMRMGNLKVKLVYKGDKWDMTVKYDKQKSHHIVHSLSEPVTTCIGPIFFDVNTQPQKGDKYQVTTVPFNKLVDDMRKEITASQVKRGTNVVMLSTVTDMPKRAEDVINYILTLYENEAAIDRRRTVSVAQVFLTDRLEKVAHQLDSVESAVAQYKQSNKITSFSDEASLYVMTSSEYQKKIVEVETQLNLIEYISAFVGNEDNLYTPIPANLGVQDGALMTLITQYNANLLNRMEIQRTATDYNPMLARLDERLTALRANIVASISSVHDGLEIMRQDLQAQEQQFGGRIGKLPEQERHFIQLQRQQAMTQQIYLFLYQKREEASLSMELAMNPTRVIDYAQTSPGPVAPRKLILLFIALILGGGIPFGIIFLQEMFASEKVFREEHTSDEVA